MAQKPLLGQGLFIIEASSSQIHHSWLEHLDEGSTRSRDLYLTSHERAIHAPRWDSNPQSQQAAVAVPCLRPRSHRDRQKNKNTALILSLYLEVRLVKCEVYIYFQKRKIMPVHAMREYRGSRVIAPLVIVSLGDRWR
jgi:hypothetical protein